jgi:hypothetical protein
MNERTTYQVEEYNRDIPLLFTRYNEGFIHSKFNNGFNIAIGDDLLFIGSNRSGQLPFAFIVNLDDVHAILNQISIGDRVTWDMTGKRLSINERCDIMYLEGRPYDNHLNFVKDSAPRLLQHVETLLLALAGNNEKTGLDLDINHFMEDYVAYNDTLNSPFQKYYDLMDILYSDNEEKIEETMRYFIGRGKGGTPAGDDHLIGLMAIHAVTNEWTPLFPEVLSQLIKEKPTTDVSIEYLKYALNQQFGSPVIELMGAMVKEDTKEVQEKINNLLAMGHSSGLDTTFGILLGLLAIRRKYNG